MSQLFLKAKHWQFFLITFALPFLAQSVMMNWMVNEITNNVEILEKANPTEMLYIMDVQLLVYAIVGMLATLVYYGWMWSVVHGLQKRIPDGITVKTGLFKLALLIPFLSSCALLLSMRGLIMGAFNKLIAGATDWDFSSLYWIIPLFFFSIFCNFYCFYVVAKTVKTVELKREVRFGDFVGEFFMTWFFPIGVFMIQPKINVMAERADWEPTDAFKI